MWSAWPTAAVIYKIRTKLLIVWQACSYIFFSHSLHSEKVHTGNVILCWQVLSLHREKKGRKRTFKRTSLNYAWTEDRTRDNRDVNLGLLLLVKDTSSIRPFSSALAFPMWRNVRTTFGWFASLRCLYMLQQLHGNFPGLHITSLNFRDIKKMVHGNNWWMMSTHKSKVTGL